MRIVDLGIRRQPFHTQGHPVTFVTYKAQRAADTFLRSVLDNNRGIGELYGAELSGKTTLVSEFVRKLPDEIPVALVDGTGTSARELLTTMLAQFRYQGSIDTTDVGLNLLNEVSARIICENQPPLLVLKNINEMYPSGLRALRKLAALTIHQRFALRIILVNKRACSKIIHSPKMNPVGSRLVGSFELGSLSAKETYAYLHAKLQASGVDHPHRVLPISTCVELHKESGGLPGKLDGMTLRAIKWVDEPPILPEHIYPLTVESLSATIANASTADPDVDPNTPKLMVSATGKLLREIEVKQPKVTIGRARLNDVVINSEYVSKFHALMIFHKNTLFLVDLKSSNGMYVNSRRVRSVVLQHEDVIEIGNHRIKVYHPFGRAGATEAELDPADTSIMKTVGDMRRAVAKKILRIAPGQRQKSK